MARVNADPIIANTTMQVYYNNQNVLTVYYIYPNEGYVLHNNAFDFETLDENGMPTGDIKQGFVPYPSFTTVAYNYDWEANPNELFTVLADTVPENQIFQ